jgi:hypothetical protein
MNRKIIQVIAAANGNRLVALADDGTLWMSVDDRDSLGGPIRTEAERPAWVELRGLPQPEEVLAKEAGRRPQPPPPTTKGGG